MQTGWGVWDWLQFLLSFALVIGLLLAMLWTLRKLQGQTGLMRRAGSRLQLLESLSVAPRQKIAIVRVDNRELLVGLTPQQITPLGWLDGTQPRAAAEITKP